MTLLGKSYQTEDIENNKGYTLPVIAKVKHDEISMPKSVFLSVLLHPATICFICLVIIVLKFMGFNLLTFDRPQNNVRDIEFVLVNKEDIPINKRTKYRADINSRAGGKHDPKKPVSMPSPAPSKATPKSSAGSPASDLQKMIKQQQKQVVQQAVKQPKQVVKQPQQQTPQKTVAKNTTTSTQKVVDQPKQIDAPKALAPRPSSTPSAPKIAQVPKSNFQIPVPKAAEPKSGVAQGGPVAGTSSGTKVGSTGGSSAGTAKGTAAPSFAPAKNAYGSNTGSGGQGRFSSGSGAGGYGSGGNPGPGNPNGRPGIDAVREPDFGPYMKELQRRIKMNWDPPKGNESKRVVLLFSISKDGRLLNVQVSKSSGVQAADRAAINAVQLTAPFKPLPAEFKGQKVDIQFTFDYNVFGANSYY